MYSGIGLAPLAGGTILCLGIDLLPGAGPFSALAALLHDHLMSATLCTTAPLSPNPERHGWACAGARGKAPALDRDFVKCPNGRQLVLDVRHFRVSNLAIRSADIAAPVTQWPAGSVHRLPFPGHTPRSCTRSAFQRSNESGCNRGNRDWGHRNPTVLPRIGNRLPSLSGRVPYGSASAPN